MNATDLIAGHRIDLRPDLGLVGPDQIAPLDLGPVDLVRLDHRRLLDLE